MKIPRRPKHQGSLDGDTMTPMIDVVFLLLVFFICASVGGTADRLLPAELKGNTQAADPQEAAENPEEWQHPAIQIRLSPEQGAVAVYLDEQRLAGIGPPDAVGRVPRFRPCDHMHQVIRRRPDRKLHLGDATRVLGE